VKERARIQSVEVGCGLLQALGAALETLLPGSAGFRLPVLNSGGHMAPDQLAIGPAGSFDAHWGGALDRPLRAAAARLSADLGHRR
jgi:hypothetical protein